MFKRWFGSKKKEEPINLTNSSRDQASLNGQHQHYVQAKHMIDPALQKDLQDLAKLKRNVNLPKKFA